LARHFHEWWGQRLLKPLQIKSQAIKGITGGRSGLAFPRLPGILNTRFGARFTKATPLFYMCAVVMTASLILGGGTRAGYLSDAILQLLAIPLLSFSLWRISEASPTKQMRAALWFCLTLVLLPLAQLIPLPPWLWTMLPHREPLVETFNIVGHTVPWMPISVSPSATWLTTLSIVPPVAIFLTTLMLGYRERRWLSLVVLTVGVVSVFVGLLQVAQGAGSPLRFFAITNQLEAVGFFANRNHFAALLYCLMLFAVAWTLTQTSASVHNSKKEFEYDLTAIIASLIGFVVLVMLLSGEVMARSRTGLGLTVVTLFAAIALGYSNRRAGSGIMPNKLIFGAVSLAVIFSLQFALYRALERFGSDPLQSARPVFADTTIEAARAYMPFGSGLGTFVPVYAMFERLAGVSDAYVNHAHNDLLEVWLETGVLGPALIGVFVVWLVQRAVKIWRSQPAHGATDLDWSLARAATIIAALVLVHSLVDYPLRTGAMMAIMAFACGLLIEPLADAERIPSATTRVQHQAKSRREPTPSPALPRPISLPDPSTDSSGSLSSGSQGGRWGADIEWPKEWSSNGKRESTSSSKPQGS
jgi:O-antigen ligase